MKLTFGQSKKKLEEVSRAARDAGGSSQEMTRKRKRAEVSGEAISQDDREDATNRDGKDASGSPSGKKSVKASGFLASKEQGVKRLKRNDDCEAGSKQKSTEDCTNSQNSIKKKGSGQKSPSKKAVENVEKIAKPDLKALGKGREKSESLDQRESSGTNSKGKVADQKLKAYDELKVLSDLTFCPAKDSPQGKGQAMPFSFLVKALQLIEQTEGKNSRTVVIETITNIFRSALVNKPEELPDIFYFFIVKLAPDFIPMETGVGHEMSCKAIAKATGKTPKEIRERFREEGDLGIVAMKGKGSQGTLGGFFKKKVTSGEKKSLTFSHVFAEFRRIAKCSGNNSALTKESIIVKLLQDSANEEAKYIIRFLQKTLKTGAAEKTVIMALARAFAYTPPNKAGLLSQKKKLGDADFFALADQMEKAINQAICESPNYSEVIRHLMVCGDQHEKLKDFCRIQVGIPVKPMLAKPTKGVQVVLKRFEGIDFTCEYKYDGFRGQIHFDRSKAAVGADCHIYSRNLEDMTVAYPDVLEIIRELSNQKKDIQNFIIDSELVAYDVTADKILPFQALTQRSRKHVNEKDLQTKIAIQAFDLLYLNDEPLLQKTFEGRREMLKEKFGELPGQFMFAKSTDTNNFEEVEKFLDASIKDCCEGLMVKSLNDASSTYEPSKRSFKWLKLKKDYLDSSLGDSVDLCVVGADYGTGKRTGWFSSFLMACWNDDLECFQTICKVGSGFTDEQFIRIKAQLEDLVVGKPANSLRIRDNLPQIKCDVYFQPKFVWEIKAADLSLSPMHTASKGSVEAEKGIALRFPRVIRERDDKDPYGCTTSEQILEMYRAQAYVTVNFNDDNDFDL